MGIFNKKPPRTAFVCAKCDGVFRGEPFSGWTGGGIIVSPNAKDLCLGCAAGIMLSEGQEIRDYLARTKARAKPVQILQDVPA